MPRNPHPPPIHLDGPKARKEDLDSSVGGMRPIPPPSQRMTIARDTLIQAIRVRLPAGHTPLYREAMSQGANIAIEALTALGVLYVE